MTPETNSKIMTEHRNYGNGSSINGLEIGNSNQDGVLIDFHNHVYKPNVDVCARDDRVAEQTLFAGRVGGMGLYVEFRKREVAEADLDLNFLWDSSWKVTFLLVFCASIEVCVCVCVCVTYVGHHLHLDKQAGLALYRPSPELTVA
uniref:Uncharacterized protein n=1 Tax=Timema bartmani TaxID=61472 RepID=A0A7R9HWJ2_9NEOP|nr:unnamed protein product [Timema bartmani]